MSTGAILPSSEALAGEIVANLNLHDAKAVVEYGPGTGAFTSHVHRALPPDAAFIAIEINPRLAEMFRERYPDIPLFQDSVANARSICNGAGIGQVDCVVSGLPWASFPQAMQMEFLDEMMRVLKPGGQFVTFAYLHGLILPPGKRFARILPKYFKSISRSRVVWKNVPPAIVYRCIR
jgi:phospholipid N-methyltransferase